MFAVPASEPTWLRQLKAAELGHPAAIVSGSAAAALHGLSGFRRGRPEVTVPATSGHRSRLAKVRRRSDVASTSVQGIRVTTVAQTLLDVAGRVGAEAFERAAADAAADGRVDVSDLADRYVAAAGSRRPGLAIVRAFVDRHVDGEPVPTTELERLLHSVIAVAGLEPVRFQAPPPWWPDGPQRVDAHLPVHRVIVEADGRRWHSRAADFERDRWRDNQAAAHGHRVVRLTWDALTRHRAGSVALLRSLRPVPEG